ncbi:hypothetical protein N0V82_000333 [Gnomoniopsis sp. IMI 355080]|nr:hypothetical protein N0V82_000333 [Gnomoniopsis sp. IMI 355080]
MSRQINQPSNQIKLTNVSMVRLKKGKKRFELACYKNKVLEWRQGIETDIDNVLQIPNVFLNVSKGQTAPTEDLQKAFGKNTKRDDIILEILNKGDIQVGDKERAAQLERVHNEVIGLVASKLVDPRTKRVYTTGMIEKALDMLSQNAHTVHNNSENKDAKGGGTGTSNTASGAGTPATGEDGEAKPRLAAVKDHHVWTGVVTTKSAKSQALEAIKALVSNQPIPVARARMRLRITCATGVLKQPVKAAPVAAKPREGGSKGGKKGKKQEEEVEEDRGDDDGEKKAPGTVKDKILGYIEQVENQDVLGSEWEVVGFVEPGAYKGLSDFISNETKGQGRVEVLDTAVTTEDD